MVNKALVVELKEGRRAVVEVERTSACEGCHKRMEGKECSVCTLMGGDRKLSAIADNAIGAKIGDTVEIETRTGRVLGYAVMVFILPLLIALTLYFATFFWETGIRLLCALLGLVATFFGIWIYSKHVEKTRTDVKISKIIRQDEP